MSFKKCSICRNDFPSSMIGADDRCSICRGDFKRSECPDCKSIDTSEWYREGDSGFECNHCGRIVENNVLIKKGKRLGKNGLYRL